MLIPINYTIRSLLSRKLTTFLTVFGISLVVFVFAASLMLSYGIEKAMTDTGSENNVILTRKASQGELASQISRDALNEIANFPEIEKSKDGTPFFTMELYTLINLYKKATNSMGNVTIRGVAEKSFELRPQVKLIKGRKFSYGKNEIIVGSNIEERFKSCKIGSVIKFANTNWTIVGIFSTDGSGFDSEIWGDVNLFMTLFNRGTIYSSMTFKTNPKNFEIVKQKIAKDKRLNYIEPKIEKHFYKEQSEMMSSFISVLGTSITIIFSIGAVIGAIITMYSSIANRVVEIGTLRALGFKRRSILIAFLFECMLISFIGCFVGIFAASFLQVITISTTNFGTFSELAFSFELTLDVIKYSIIFSVIMGFIGGVFPAVRASFLSIINALRMDV